MVSSPWPPAIRRSISSKTFAVALWLVAVFAVLPQTARADDRGSVEAGRADARAVLILADLRACGIALLRDRCITDIDAFLHGRGDGDFGHLSKVGPHPASGLRAFVSNGDRDGFDPALSWINYRQATEAQWKADPRDAALYDAGVLDVFMAGTTSELGERLAAAPGADLAIHAAQVPAGALPIDIGPLRDLHMTRPNALRVLPFVRDLVRRTTRRDSLQCSPTGSTRSCRRRAVRPSRRSE
jgi:hypothetical protein